MKTKVLEYQGEEKKTFEVRFHLSSDPRRKFVCNPGDSFIFGEQIENKTAIFLVSRFQSYFRIVQREVTDFEICAIRIGSLIEEFGAEVVEEVVQKMADGQKNEKTRKSKKSVKNDSE